MTEERERFLKGGFAMEDLIIHQNFDEFYANYYSLVYYYIYKKINQTEEAEDLAGDVFCSCYKNYSSYDSAKSSIKTWLFVIVNNRLKNYYRDKKTVISLEDQIDEKYLHTNDDYMAQSILLEDYRNILADAISTLPEKNQLVLILKYFGEKKSEEIAKIVGMSTVNVRVTISRTLKKINEYLINKGWNGEI